MKYVVAAAIIRPEGLVLVDNKEVYTLPGGTKNENETDLECLIREIKEELDGTKLQNIQHFQRFEGVSPGGSIINLEVYLADVDGELRQPKNDEDVTHMIVTYDFNKLPLSELTRKVVDVLYLKNMLK